MLVYLGQIWKKTGLIRHSVRIVGRIQEVGSRVFRDTFRNKNWPFFKLQRGTLPNNLIFR